jgi:orotidine-5'-phosphate decarboxylase
MSAEGADYINVYAQAGKKPITKLVDATKKDINTLVLTVLTHYDNEYCQKIYGRSLKDTVNLFSNIGYESGAHGIILPGIALDEVKELDILKVVPGIKPEWSIDKRGDYQKQVVTPRMAVEKGADILVCGTAICKNENPPEALERVLEEMQL